MAARFPAAYWNCKRAHPTPHCGYAPGKALNGPHLGFVQGPEHLALKPDGSPARIDKAFTWEAPLAVHGMLHTVIANAVALDPYPIEVLFLYPIAVELRAFGTFALVETIVFIGLLLVAFAYVWRRGALTWR